MRATARAALRVLVSVLTMRSSPCQPWTGGGNTKVPGYVTGQMDPGYVGDLIDEIDKVDSALAADILTAYVNDSVGFATLIPKGSALEGVADHDTVAIKDGLSVTRGAAVLAHEWQHRLHRSGQGYGTTPNDRMCDEASAYAAELAMLENLAVFHVADGGESPIKCADFYTKAKNHVVHASLCHLGGGSCHFHDGEIPTGHCK